MTRFILLTLPRSGSGLLIKSLNKHPEIFCSDELFYLSFRKRSGEHRFKFFKIKFFSKQINYLINYPFTRLRINAYLEKFFKKSRKEKLKAKGFKLTQLQILYTPGLANYIKTNDVKIIFLTRRNILRNALSLVRTRSKKVYKSNDDVEMKEESLISAKMVISLSKLKQKMHSVMHENNQLNKFVRDKNHIKIYYEDFVDMNNTMNKICEFLNVPASTILFENETKNTDLKSIIENYSELEAWLKQNDYDEFIN